MVPKPRTLGKVGKLKGLRVMKNWHSSSKVGPDLFGITFFMPLCKIRVTNLCIYSGPSLQVTTSESRKSAGLGLGRAWLEPKPRFLVLL
jgi:hypothetical protein